MSLRGVRGLATRVGRATWRGIAQAPAQRYRGCGGWVRISGKLAPALHRDTEEPVEGSVDCLRGLQNDHVAGIVDHIQAGLRP